VLNFHVNNFVSPYYLERIITLT